ncbi:hypothetical protein BOX15_Mlig010956g1 [Macrostomum lignano]|uniref:SH3 domain-containing protein n=1 Tax=Macrostomum lignano TaxID=282301 RepID=A0A267DU86_9PLAT|nr:hypothetical protein BOX15_Mlig010956g1 [Macrostomum lignano]
MDHQLDLSSLPPPPPEFFLDNFDNDEEFIFSNSNCKDYNCTIKQGIDPGLTNAHGRTAKEVIARDTPFARELHQILYERISAVAAVAIRDFCNLADPRSIAFRAGEHLTVLERTNGDTWKGYVTREGLSRAGYFPCSAVRLLEQPQQQQQQQQHQQRQDPPTCLSSSLMHQSQPHQMPPVSQSTPASNAAVSPTSGSNNRNSAASLDSGRSSSHTATSSDTRSAVAVTASGPSGPAGANSSTGSAAAAAAASAGTMCSRVLNSATNTPRSAAAPAAANGSVDSGLGPHRQSMVSTCSSGSLGSLPDDNSSAASVSSGELQYQQQQQHGWLREDWRSLTSSQQLHRFLDWCQLACYHRSIEEAGYDLATLVRCTPEDLNAAGVTNPRHRKRLRSDLARLGQAMQAGQAPGGLPDPIEDAVCLTADAALTELCCRLGLPDTASACLRRAGFQLVRDLGQMAWEDLEEIGISRLGHQKKLMLVIDRLRRPRHGPESDQHQPDQQQGTLRRQSAKSTVSCGTCTSSDSIAVQPDPFLAAESQQQPPQSPPQPSCHSRSFSGSGAAQQSVKLLGRPIPVAVPEVPPQQPPPTPQRGAPPPPPKRVTSVRRCSGDAGSVTPCASPSTTPRHQAARPPAYENAAALADSPALARLGAAASAMPFANEDCGTIRHKPASASIAAAVASPQFGRAALFQQHRQHQHQLHHQLQHLPASPAFARRVPASAAAAAAAAPPTPSRWVLQPPPPREDPARTWTTSAACCPSCSATLTASCRSSARGRAELQMSSTLLISQCTCCVMLVFYYRNSPFYLFISNLTTPPPLSSYRFLCHFFISFVH